jgi:hypothetical protein
MYVISTNDIQVSQDFFTGKWKATHVPTGVTSIAYDYGLVTQEILLNQEIPLHFENPSDSIPPVPFGYKDNLTEVVIAQFREAVRDVSIDQSRIKIKHLHRFPTPDAWLAFDNGYQAYGHTEDEAIRKLLVCKPYLKSLLDEQFPIPVLARA